MKQLGQNFTCTLSSLVGFLYPANGFTIHPSHQHRSPTLRSPQSTALNQTTAFSATTRDLPSFSSLILISSVHDASIAWFS